MAGAAVATLVLSGSPSICCCAAVIFWRRGTRERARCAINWRCLKRNDTAPLPAKNSTPCYVVCDHNGQQLAYVYFEDEPERRSAVPTKDEAGRTAAK